MPCESCGAAVQPVDVDEPRGSGSFSEKWECANGHYGYVHGKEQEPAKNWSRFGQVFRE